MQAKDEATVAATAGAAARDASRRVVTRVRREKDEVVASAGMVVAKQPPAALAGLEILEQGGNAVDAAVATAFACGVVMPLATGLGGGGYIVFHEARTGQTHVLDYALQAPLAAHERMFELDPAGGYTPGFGWRLVNRDANRRGWRSIAVPGQVAGLSLALERWGTMRLDQALAPAIRLAEEGFPVSQEVVHGVVADWPLLQAHPSTYASFADNGRPRRVGEVWRRPALARTLRRLVEAGPEDFYRGQIARDIAADMAAGGGLVSLEDLERYRAREAPAPLSITYRGAAIRAAPGPAGAATMLQILKLLEGFDVAGLGTGNAAGMHHWIEAVRLAFADRSKYLADPAVVDVPWGGLLSDGYAAERRQLIQPERARRSYPHGDPWPHEGRPRPAVDYPPSAQWGTPGTSTLCAADAQHNLVALTDTLVGWSGVVLPRTGLVMNNGMMWFDPEPGHANSIGPGKRGLNNMAPAVVVQDGKPLLAVGARGGRKIVATVAQVISNVLDHGMGAQAAVSEPLLDCTEPATRIHSRTPHSVREELERMGHTLRDLPGNPGANPSVILVDWPSGTLHGGDEPYGEGIAAGLV
jgi:gamma-glutamyltranspeptidase/glutathione hydrolase